MSKKVLFLLFLFFVFGYFLRILFLPSNALTFGYDQARDAVSALEIAQGHLKVFGPPASQPGLFHGVFYYYVLSPFYAIGHGSPIVAAYGIALISSLTIFIVYLLTYLMTRNLPAQARQKTSLIAAFLFAISFEATQYATWLSNPTLGIVTVPLMYLGLWMWIHKKNWGPIAAALGLGLSIQSEIFLVYHMIPLIIWLFVARKDITRKQVFIFLGILAVTLSSMFLAQLKFGIGGTINGIKGLALADSGNLAYEKSLGDYLILYLNQIGRIFSFNSYPGNVGWGGGFVLGLIGYSLFKRKITIDPKVFVSTWLLSHLTVVTVGGTSTPFLMVGIGPAVSILIALYLGVWLEMKHKILVGIILLVITYGNISMILNQNKNGATLFSIQKDMILSKQISAIDYTYKQSGGKFSINTLTSPLWINIVWSYLYEWYGQNNYGYVPTWHGRDQIGQVDSLLNDDNLWQKGFLIIEPQDGIPTQYLPLVIGQEDSYSKLVNEKNFGAIRIQERIKNDK